MGAADCDGWHQRFAGGNVPPEEKRGAGKVRDRARRGFFLQRGDTIHRREPVGVGCHPERSEGAVWAGGSLLWVENIVVKPFPRYGGSMKLYYVYILASLRRVLYIGV